MDEIYIESVIITPNPCICGKKVLIKVELYTLFPAENLYPAEGLYPGADLFTLYPSESIFPSEDIYPTEGGIET